MSSIIVSHAVASNYIGGALQRHLKSSPCAGRYSKSSSLTGKKSGNDNAVVVRQLKKHKLIKNYVFTWITIIIQMQVIIKNIVLFSICVDNKCFLEHNKTVLAVYSFRFMWMQSTNQTKSYEYPGEIATITSHLLFESRCPEWNLQLTLINKLRWFEAKVGVYKIKEENRRSCL